MALVKCPRCELNYILDGGELCTVCRREIKGEHETIDMPEMCSECGENPAVPGGELCIFCLKEMTRRGASSVSDDSLLSAEDANIEIDSVSTMDEIELDIVDDDMVDEFADDEDFKDDDEAEDEDEMVSIDSLAEAEDQDDEEEED